MKRCIPTGSVLLFFLSISASASTLPSIEHYSLKLRVFPKERRLTAVAQLSIRNDTPETQAEISLLLYRLLEVQSISDEKGKQLEFSQRVVALSDSKNLQVNVVKVKLGTNLRPKESLRLMLNYEGAIFGYPEVMTYVRDTVDEQYSLLRPDAFAFPILADPSFKSVYAQDSLFTYDVETTVPANYTVASGGALTGTRQDADLVTFVHKSKIPTWRMDVAVAKFKVVTDEENKLSVYALSGEEQSATRFLNSMEKVISFYTRQFGPVKTYQGYTAIEIPDGWGSQAGDYYFLQTSAAFNDSKRIGEMYHEVGHTWNVKPKTSAARCRYFDEAFASYFEALATREFEGEAAFLGRMERLRTRFMGSVEQSRRNYATPISQYGKEELGRLSYTKGAWSLYVLHQVVGDEKFRSIIRELLANFGESGADFDDFRATVAKVTGANPGKFLPSGSLAANRQGSWLTKFLSPTSCAAIVDFNPSALQRPGRIHRRQNVRTRRSTAIKREFISGPVGPSGFDHRKRPICFR